MISIEYFSRLPGQIRANDFVVPSRVIEKMLNLDVLNANLRVQHARMYDIEVVRTCVTIWGQRFSSIFGACSAASSIEYVLSSFSMKRIIPQFKSKSISNALASWVLRSRNDRS